jgi:hypothetical protein
MHRQSYGDRAVIRRVLHRIGTLYLVQLVLLFTLSLALECHLPGASNFQRFELLRTDPLKAVVLGASLLYQPQYLDILPMYCFFLILTPLVLWQLQTGHLRRVLACSGALWLIAGLTLHLPRNPLGVNFGAFNPLCHQFLFVIGICLGAKRVRLGGFEPAVRRPLIVVSVAIAALFLLLRWGYALVPAFTPFVDRLSPLSSAGQLGPLRLLNFALFGVTVAWVLEKTKSIKAENVFSRSLVMLGQHSLGVFAWSTIATYAAVMLLPSVPSMGWRLAELILALASLYVAALLSVAHSRYHRAARAIIAQPSLPAVQSVELRSSSSPQIGFRPSVASEK